MPALPPLKISSGDLAQFSGSDTVASANLGTGTASSSTFLRGDGTWNVPTGAADGPLPVRVATTANIALTGTQTIDGVALSATNLVLVKDQTVNATNAVYVVAAGAWTVAPSPYNLGMFTVLVVEGTVNAAAIFNNITLSTPTGARQTGRSTALELDFGSPQPVWTKTFIIADAAILSTDKVLVFQDSTPATGRVGDDTEWDQLLLSSRTATGQIFITAVAFPGPIVGRRRVNYQVTT